MFSNVLVFLNNAQNDSRSVEVGLYVVVNCVWA